MRFRCIGDELARKNSSGRHQSCEGHWALFTPAPYCSRVSPHPEELMDDKDLERPNGNVALALAP